MPAMPWLRLYTEFASDPVTQSLAFEDQRHFIILLCLKGNGTLDRPMRPESRDRIIYRGLGLDPNTAEEAKRRLMDAELIDTKWHPKAWDKRQFISDHSTERSRNYRKNKETGNDQSPSPQRKCDGPRTDTEQIQNRTEDPPIGGRAPRAKAKRQLPADFELTPERMAVIRELSPAADPFAEFSQFSDHHRSRGTVMLDWDAAWRTWCRNSKKFSKGVGSDRKNQSPLDRIQEAYRREFGG